MVADNRGTRIAARYVEQAISDEWFAHYQYWVGSVIMSPDYEDVITQFIEHSVDEYEHATWLAGWLRNVPRAGLIPYAPSELSRHQYCGYIYPTGNFPAPLIADNIRGEHCAITFYYKFLKDISDKEYYGSDLGEMLERILEKEQEHKADLYELSKRFK